MSSLTAMIASINVNISIAIPTQVAETPTGMFETICSILNVSSLADFMNPAISAINGLFGPIQISLRSADFSKMFSTTTAMGILNMINITYNGTSYTTGDFIKSFISKPLAFIFDDNINFINTFLPNLAVIKQNLLNVDVLSLLSAFGMDISG